MNTSIIASPTWRASLACRLLSTTCLGVGVCLAGASVHTPARAQQASSGTVLPQVVVEPSKQRSGKKKQDIRSSSAGSKRRVAAVRRTASPPAQAQAASDTFAARTGTAGYYSNSSSVVMKTNTPLLNTPQSVTVLSKDFIQDQGTHSVTDLTRYVPGVAVHQGEGNRDELVIRGVDSSANFFVNGFRDDVQYFRDLYNAQSVEVLKGPSALVFGRGAGGGLVNRTLKEADGTRVYEAMAQSGSYGDRRFTLDAGQAVNSDVAVRLNAFYEGSDTFRDYGHLERYGFNPTLTWRPTNDTKIKLSYEYYHDQELPDRGNPSILLPGGIAATRFNPTAPFAPNGDFTKFYGSPIYNTTHADVQTGIATIEHDFGNGLTVKNSTLAASYDRGYQNVFPSSDSTAAVTSGSVNPTTGAFSYSAYNNTTNRDNVFNQTDFTYKFRAGSTSHTLAFGTEFDWQSGLSLRNTGIFANGSASINSAIAGTSAFDPTFFGPVTFQHFSAANPALGVANPDANSRYSLNVQSAYVQDQVDVTRWLQLIGGVRFDRFDLGALDQNTGIRRARTDDTVSPRTAIIVKPVDNVSIYGVWSQSYLPASGDQFSALSDGTLILTPQKFDNKEVGVKWDIAPKLQYTAAVYQLDRTNVPLSVGNGFFVVSGKNQIKGFETALAGYVNPDWQSTLGYAYTDARITSNTSATIVAGNRVQLVPFNQFSWWNKYRFDYHWSAGLGLIYFSDSFASSDDTVRLPGFVRVDAAIYMKVNETWSGQLNVENLFDKGYWASADGNNNISPGQGRTFRVLARAKF